MSTPEILGAAEYVALTTFRAGGEPVITPVWAARHGERLVVYTPVRSGKVRRLRQRPDVTVAVSEFTGERRGPAVAGTARVLARSEQGPAVRALGRPTGGGSAGSSWSCCSAGAAGPAGRRSWSRSLSAAALPGPTNGPDGAPFSIEEAG